MKPALIGIGLFSVLLAGCSRSAQSYYTAILVDPQPNVPGARNVFDTGPLQFSFESKLGRGLEEGFSEYMTIRVRNQLELPVTLWANESVYINTIGQELPVAYGRCIQIKPGRTWTRLVEGPYDPLYNPHTFPRPDEADLGGRNVKVYLTLELPEIGKRAYVFTFEMQPE